MANDDLALEYMDVKTTFLRGEHLHPATIWFHCYWKRELCLLVEEFLLWTKAVTEALL